MKYTTQIDFNSKALTRHIGLTRRWRAVERGDLVKLLHGLTQAAKSQQGLFGEEGEDGDE